MKKPLLVMIVVSLAVVSVWKLRDRSAAQRAEVSALNRIWVDHMPKNDRDVFNVFVAITEDPIGIFQATSQWKGTFEMFRHESSGNEIRVIYPQTGDRDKITTKARSCDERSWDFCLELGGSSRGVKQYYSLEGWEIEGSATAEQVRDKVTALLAHTEAR